MPTVKVRNLKNKEVGEVELSDAVFGAELNEALIHSAVKKPKAPLAAGSRRKSNSTSVLSGSCSSAEGP